MSSQTLTRAGRMGLPRAFGMPPRATLAAAAAVAGAAGFGLLAAYQPAAALVLMAAAAVAFLTLRFPAANLALIVAVTTLVPFGVQNRLGIEGGGSFPGLLFVDILLALGLCRLAVIYAQRPWRASMLLAVGLLLVTLAQMAHGIVDGEAASVAGNEARRLLVAGGAFLLAIPILEDEAARRRLYVALLLTGLALGLWGLAQWFLQVVPDATGDVGVRGGVPLTTSGKGQLQGGLFGFPVAVILAFAVLISGHVRSRWAQLALWLTLLTNIVSLVLTYERTFWAAAVIGCAFVALRAARAQRAKALLFAPGFVILLFLSFAVVAPDELTTARERFESVAQYRTDKAVRYRTVETDLVQDEIALSPVVGSGLGATMTWGTPGEFKTQTTPFAHNGYLWLSWKTGVPVAAFLTLLVLAAALRPNRLRGRSMFSAFRNGCQAGLLALLIINFTFPTFHALGITAMLGLMLAVCVVPDAVQARSRA